MSFILDNTRLIQLLTVAGADHLNKYGQVDTSPQSVMDHQLAQKLLIGLQRTVDPDNAPSKAVLGMMGKPPGTPIGLTTDYLKSLGDLLNWSATNKITWNGKRFAWTDAEKKGDTANTLDIPEDAGMFDVKGVKRERNTETRQPVQYLMWVSKPALIDFITFLRDSDEARKNKVFQVMIGKLITQANDSLEDNEQINKAPKAKPGAPGTIAQDAELTTFPPILNLEDYDANGDKPLKYLDIQSADTIINWVKRNITGARPDSKTEPVAPTHKNFDYCLVIKILYSKAQLLLRNQAATPDLRAKYTAFVEQMVKVAPTMSGPDGKACSLVAATQPGAKPGEATGGKVTTATLQQMVNALPLDANDIDFNRIRYFNGLFTQLLGASNNPRASEITRTMADTDAKMRQITSMTKTNATQVNLYENPRGIADMLTDPANKAYTSFLANLEYVVEMTARVVGQFHAMYARPPSAGEEARPTFTPDQRAAIEYQFQGGDSYMLRNTQMLNSLARRYTEVVKYL